jgi:hypothetical protein
MSWTTLFLQHELAFFSMSEGNKHDLDMSSACSMSWRFSA